MRPLSRSFIALLILTFLAPTLGAFAQAERTQFDVVSIRENQTGGPSSSNFPLDPTARYNYRGDLLRARNIPLLQLLVFAYAILNRPLPAHLGHFGGKIRRPG